MLGFSAIVTGQGGPSQGQQQLSVYNDYNCCQQTNEGHFNGTDRVEANVFQEPRSAGSPITAADIGKTFTFSFDAKVGNINDPSDPECEAPNMCDSTARAFIQTLDPSASFNRTTDWNRFEISLDLTDPLLEGQVLQFGFSSNAKSFEPSGIFYDNVLAELESP